MLCCDRGKSVAHKGKQVITKLQSKRQRTAREISSGGVVFYHDPEGIRYLLIRDSYGRWALPKGKIEAGESPEQAALREICEEVGLSEVELRERLPSIRYVYTDQQGVLKFKLVHFFLVELVRQQEPQPDPNEIGEVRWFSATDMLATFQYADTEEVLVKAIELAEQSSTHPSEQA